MIKFITEMEESELEFGDVEIYQFFVDLEGCLCQKIDFTSYVTIANEGGDPFCCLCKDINSCTLIQRILPITTIKF